MTTTVLELIANLKHYPGEAVVTINDVDDQKFAIVDFHSGVNGLKIVIGETVDEGEPEDEE